ncbi:MAG TPA: hypothetical protein ENK13_04435, partial [Thermopetrobacter sp.]|nr:hypothetical protein [Thermopetrobacter sp.]
MHDESGTSGADPSSARGTAAVPAMVAAGTGALRLQAGRRETLGAEEALRHLAAEPHVVCHAGMLTRRL